MVCRYVTHLTLVGYAKKAWLWHGVLVISRAFFRSSHTESHLRMQQVFRATAPAQILHSFSEVHASHQSFF